MSGVRLNTTKKGTKARQNEKVTTTAEDQKSEVDNSPDEQTVVKEQESSARPKKIYFILTFPDLTEEEFNSVVGGLKKVTEVDYLGFKFTYDPKDPDQGFERYRKHYNDMLKAIANHTRTAENSYKKRGREVEIETIFLPKDETSADEVRSKLKKLRRGDEIYVNAHGNTNLIGLGPLTMEPIQIAKSLVVLGIPKVMPPHFAIWSCNSGTLKGTTALIHRVKTQLIKLKVKSPIVTGTTDLLVNQPRGPSYVGHRVTAKDGTTSYKRNPKKDWLHTVSTPKSQKIISGIKIAGNAGLFTVMHKRNFHRTSYIGAMGLYSPRKKIIFDSPAIKQKLKQETVASNVNPSSTTTITKKKTKKKIPEMGIARSRPRRTGTG